jgi:hypothetical protein
MAKPIRDELEETRQALQEYDCTIRWEESRPDMFIVFAFCSDATEFARAKMVLEPLVQGRVMLDEDGAALWNDYFDLPNSVKHLDKLNGSDKFLLRDYRNRRVLVFGNLEEAQQSLLRMLKVVQDQQFSIDVTEPGFIAGLLNGGFEELENDGIGANKLSLDFVSRSLNVRGKIDITHTINQKLDEFQKATVEDGNCCGICSLAVIDPVTLRCAHTYCKRCLVLYIKSMIGPGFAPLRCLATCEDGKKCSVDIPHRILQTLLSEQEQTDLFEMSFLHFINLNRQEYQVCPSLPCQTVYRVGCHGTIVRCPGCVTWICAHCQVELHEGLTCDEYMVITGRSENGGA